MTIILIAIYFISAAIVIFLLNRYVHTTKSERRNIYDALLSPEALEKHAVEVARTHIVTKNSGSVNWLLVRVNENYRFITEVYKKLNDLVNEKKGTVAAAEWLLDNFYIIEQQVKEIRQSLANNTFNRLPIIKEGSQKGYPRVYAIALELVAHTDGSFDDRILINFIKAYQTNSILSTSELWAVSMMIRIALIENIRRICEKINKSQQQLLKADELVEFILSKIDEPNEMLIDLIKEHMKNIDKMHSSYAEYLLQKIKKEGHKAAAIVQYFDERLMCQDTTAEKIIRLEHQDQAAIQVSMGNSITSFRFISGLDWTEVFDALSYVEEILRQDPCDTYRKMDFESRDYYRQQVVSLAKKFKTSETQVAQKAVECASAYQEEGGKQNERNERFSHVGNYLLLEEEQLQKKLGYKFTRIQRYSEMAKKYTTLIYILSIILGILLITVLFGSYAYQISKSMGLTILACFAVFIPTSDIVVTTVHWFVTHICRATILPKLELKEGIPEKYATMVVIPTLLPNAERVHDLLEQIEVHYLANREKNIYFGIVGDFIDATEKELPEDNSIVETAITGIKGLNEKYGELFFYFHRDRKLNEIQNKWMGWERKRGALMEFNHLLSGAKDTSFTTIVGELDFNKIKYVITLDADTKLPMGTAKKLIGTLAHPINRPVIDEQVGRVVEGYGLLQPRIGVDIESANASLFSQIFAGQGGIDLYTTAVSDVYQDLFGEGIFTGKGIYEVDTFERLLTDTIPDNTVLSHDLLEGSYVRVGLVTDIELIDGYPSKYNAYIARLHRWVRGDWQLLPWLFSRIKNRQGQTIKNPLSTVSKWKIIDNLRRSLVAPSTILLIVLSVSILPGSSWIWLLYTLLTVSFTLITTVLDALLSRSYRFCTLRCHGNAVYGIKASLFQIGLLFVFLPYQAYMMVDAILRTLMRVFISKRNMLEWVTAADVERRLKNNYFSFLKRMWISAPIGIIVLGFSLIYRVNALPFSIMIFILWSIAPFVAYSISRVAEHTKQVIPEEDIEALRRLARKTWRYFEDFVTEKENYLPPDNYQEEPPNGVAHRTSPTNIGMLLMSILAAKDLGYIGTIEMAEKIQSTLSTIQKLKKWKGHLYNWYDTRTLQALRPIYVSTVDSGNFIGYLMTLNQGLKEIINEPMLDNSIALGLKDTILLVKEKDMEAKLNIEPLESLAEKDMVKGSDWCKILDEFILIVEQERSEKDSWWKYKVSSMLASFKRDIQELMAWSEVMDNIPPGIINTDGTQELNTIKNMLDGIESNIPLKDLMVRYSEVINEINNLGEIDNNEFKGWKNTLKQSLETSYRGVQSLIDKYENLIQVIQTLIDETKFASLFSEEKKFFSIGYNVEEDKLTKSYYDLLASEARQTSFIAIARGEIDQKHWFRLGRNLTMEDGYKGLVSWTGTMFEYLMPLLIMRNYKNTLWDETYWYVIRSQKKYGQQRRVPWGTSESGYYAFDFNLNYQYKAFGVPGLGLKRGLVNNMVVAPYATIMALQVDPLGSIENIKKLKAEGLDGAYGLYEAIDYTPRRLPHEQKSGIVKSIMVHHQGMSLMALTNFLMDNNMQKRFHNDPIIKSAALLLQEKVPMNVIITKENKEEIKPLKPMKHEYEDLVRVLGLPDKPLPQAHILSNNSYSVMLTESGAGYSKNNEMVITRWRDQTIPRNFGMFFYIHDVVSHNIWSATYAPYYYEPNKYRVVFSPDKIDFFREDGKIDTHTEIVVSPEDNAEIRCVSLTNHNKEASTLEITSYFETVLTSQSADMAHPAFSNLFVRTEFLPEYKTLLANRRPREEGKEELWATHTIFVEGEHLGNLQFETDRSKFIGRGRSLTNPIVMEPDHPLSNTVGAVLDPVMSLRTRIRIEPGQTIRISYITGVSSNREKVIKIAQKYQDTNKIARAFELAWTRSQVESRYLGLKASEKELYVKLIPQIVFLSPLRRKREEYIFRNKKGQSSLWAFGISGDVPLVLVCIEKTDQIDIVQQLLKAHEYWRMKGLAVDLLILNEYEGSYTQPLQDLLRDTVSASHARDLQDKTGGIFIRKAGTMTEEDKTLLYAVARIVIHGCGGSIEAQTEYNYQQNKLPDKKKWEVLPTVHKIQRQEPKARFFDNGWGGFSKDGKEYIIQLKENQQTPAPWINVISNEKFGFQVSESGGGYTWSENSRENKLTPWSNDPISDTTGEVFYLRDENTGEVWTITPLPIREPEPYIIRHGFGYSVFEHVSHGIEQKLTMFVAKDDSVKICIIKLKNHSREKRLLSATYYMRPVLGVSDQLTAQHITTRMTPEKDILLIENNYNEDFPGRIAFMDVSEVDRSYTGDVLEFIGDNNATNMPEAMKRSRLSNSVGAGYDPCAAIQVKIQLDAHDEKEIVFLLGQTDNAQNVMPICNKYRYLGAAHKELERVKYFWGDLLSVTRIKTTDLSMNIMLNGWLLYQVLSCRIWARSAFYQSGGAYGFRDQLQDVMAVVNAMPQITYNQVLQHTEHQFVEGDVQHWWHPVGNKSDNGDKGIRTKFSDDLVWLPFVVGDYIENTEDYSLLDVETGYLEADPLGKDVDEKYDIPRISEEKSSVYEHCIRAIERALKFGERGIPLMGSGDWNDGMNTVGNKGKGESVWLGWFIYTTLMRFIPICEAKGEHERAKKYRKIAREMVEAIENNAWDGSWYRRAYFDDGTPMGSAQNTECRIDSLAQSWAIISGAGNPERTKAAMEALESYLIKRDEGLIMLLTPPFDKGDLKPGYIKGYVPGVRENGGQYTHAAIWVVMAFAKMGNGDKAWELYNLINPINHARTPMEAARYKVEPYVMAADVYAVHPNIGRGGWTWYTGAAGWMYRVGIEHLLGLKKRGDKLIIDPCIPRGWDEYGIDYRYQSTKYAIQIKNPDGINKGVKSVNLDGTVMDNKIIPLTNDGVKHKIEVVMGNEG